jgi:hypothetical protein
MITQILADVHLEVAERWARRRARSAGIEHYNNTRQMAANGAHAVFVLSTGRCGTLSLTHLFKEVRDTVVHHAPHPEMASLQAPLYKLAREKEAATSAAVALSVRLEMLEAAAFMRKTYIETNAKLAFLAGGLAQAYPHARFVHLTRSPHGYVRSVLARHYYDQDGLDKGLPQPTDETVPKWSRLSREMKCAWLWNETNAHIADSLDKYAEGRSRHLRMEDLTPDGESILPVLEWLDLPAPSPRRIARAFGRKLNASSTQKRTLNEAIPWEEVLAYTPRRGEWGY